MSQWIPISEDMPAFSWSKNPSRIDTALDTLVPLVLDELLRVTKDMVAVFIKNEGEDGYQLCGLQSLQPGANVYVDSSGQWLGNQLPGFYKNLPFGLIPVSEDEIKVLVDQDSPSFHQPPREGDCQLFNAEGEFSDDFHQHLDQLRQYQDKLEHTQARVDLLAQHDLIEPWPFNFDLFRDGKPLRVEGLYRVNETKLLALPSGTVKELLQMGAISLAYAQLFSMARIEDLAQLYLISDQAKAEIKHRQSAAKKAELELPSEESTDEDDLFKM